MKSLRNSILSFSRALFLYGLLAITTACQDSIPEVPHNPKGDGQTIEMEVSVAIPDMPVLNSRGGLADTPGQNLKLTIFEFDLGESTDNSFLSNIYKAELKTTSAVANEGVVTFKFTLLSSTKPKVLHLVVADEYKTWEYAPVSDVLSALTVGSQGNETEAYWGRVEFKNGYNEVNDDGSYKLDEDNNPILLSEVRQKLTNIPVIRNFAKISLSVAEDVDNFVLLGFDVVNIPTSGTVAPWNQKTQSIPALLDDTTKKMKSYDNVSEIYSGILPGNALLRNTETAAKNWTATSENLNNSDDIFMYEHPYEESRRTYLIVHGRFIDGDKSTDGFYKLDIGKIKSDGTFNYYNIIRNIQYNVVISDVLAAGMSTVSEAIQRAPFNNLIAATETSSMLNVSDGKNMLIVNDTNHIIVTDNENVTVLYRYLTNITGTSQEQNGLAHTVGLARGTVIADWSEDTYTDSAGAGWKRITITPYAPTQTVQTQDFTIVDNSGLGRTIHLILRQPWQYAPLKNADGSDSQWTASVAPGISNNFPFTSTITTPTPQPISAKIQEPLTVYFNLPNGLPESMFPLDFYLEAKYQGIENNKIGTLVVTPGPSLFPDKEGQITIQYIKTVTYNEYRYQYEGDGQNNIDFNSFNVDHTIRCRFLTITAEEVTGAEILIHNDYFRPDISVTFNRTN